jgi:hypothetical protein
MSKGYKGQSCSEAIQDFLIHTSHPVTYSEILAGVRSDGDWKEITIWRIIMSNIVNLVPARHECRILIPFYFYDLTVNMNCLIRINTQR